MDGGSAIRVRHEVWVGWLPSQQKEWGNCERAKAQRMVWGIWQSHALGGMVCPPTCWCLGFWSGQWGNASQAIGIENHLMFSWWFSCAFCQSNLACKSGLLRRWYVSSVNFTLDLLDHFGVTRHHRAFAEHEQTEGKMTYRLHPWTLSGTLG